MKVLSDEDKRRRGNMRGRPTAGIRHAGSVSDASRNVQRKRRRLTQRHPEHILGLVCI